MAFSKSLLIKGLAASTAIGGTALTIHQKDNISSLFSKEKKAWGDLECEEKDGSVCSIKQRGKILIKKEGNTSFEVSDLGGGVIKLYMVEGDNNYNEGFKFVIEDNDIAGVSGENNKLEQFETYEVKFGEKDNSEETLKDKYYLSRKTDAKTEIKKALGLPEGCNLPANGSSQDCDITAENIGKINFGGEAARVSGNGIKLSISKDSSGDYPFGYKFTFSSTSQATLTIGEKAINIKNGSSVDFKIKRSEKGNEISLENAWTSESLAKKIGLKKSEGDYWDIDTGGLKVNKDSHKETGKTKSGTPSGKIKLYKEKWEYNQGFKFSIEDGDIDLTGEASTISKLEEFETYEIKQETDGTWYLTKKGDDVEKIKSLLGVPCDLPTSNGSPKECDITTTNIKTINFGGETATISGNGIKLSISKETTKTEFPLGYKFTFKNTNNSQATLTIGSKTINIKTGGDIDFKIKKTGSSLSLENAWTLDFLTKKVGLKKEGDYWDIDTGGLKVKQGSTKLPKKTKKGTPEGKIKVSNGQGEYNQGFKFSIENGDIELNGDNSSILLSQFESYEIVKESDGQWYFSRREDDRERIKSLLGLPWDLPTTSSNSKDCGDISKEKIGNIKFDGAGNSTPTLSGSTLLNIHKESNRLDYPLGYKFTFKSTSLTDSTITLSSETSNSIVLKSGTDIDFKIKRSGSNNETLALEKAWTADDLMNKVSFKKDGDGWVPGDGTMNIKQRNDKSTSVKKSSGANSAKIRAYEGVSGYSQGIKFVVEDGDANLTGDSKISKLSKYETYEVLEDSSDNNKWYFVRSRDSSTSIKDILEIPTGCLMPTSNPSTCTLDSTKLNKIKFEGKPDNQSATINGGSSVTLNISKESNVNDYPLGFKFTFPSSNSHGFTIPQAINTASITVNSGTEACFKIKESKGKLTLEKKSS